MSESPVEYALSEMWFPFAVSYPWIMTFLAAALGFSLVSREVNRGTLFLMLAKPVSRGRMLLTKYGVCAGALMAVIVLGVLGLVISAGLNEYPLGAMSAVGLVLSTALVWLGSLFVLGLATLVSVVFRDVVASAVATPLFLVLVLFSPGLFVSYLVQYWDWFLKIENPGQAGEQFMLPLYWANQSLFAGESLAATNFLVCAIAAAIPLLAAFWIFNRKAY